VKKKVVELQRPNPVVRAERRQWARGGKRQRERVAVGPFNACRVAETV
jgi:hypothetical protein